MSFRKARLKSNLPLKAKLTPQGSHEDRQQPAPEAEGSDDATTPARISGTARRTQTSKRRIQRRATALDVLQQPIQAGVRKVFDLRRFLIVIGLTAIVMLLPQPDGGGLRMYRVNPLQFKTFRPPGDYFLPVAVPSAANQCAGAALSDQMRRRRS